MVEHAETGYDVAKARVEEATTIAEAAHYLFWKVNFQTLRALAQKAGLCAIQSISIDMSWCKRLAERLRGNPVA